MSTSIKKTTTSFQFDNVLNALLLFHCNVEICMQNKINAKSLLHVFD